MLYTTTVPNMNKSYGVNNQLIIVNNHHLAWKHQESHDY